MAASSRYPERFGLNYVGFFNFSFWDFFISTDALRHLQTCVDNARCDRGIAAESRSACCGKHHRRDRALLWPQRDHMCTFIAKMVVVVLPLLPGIVRERFGLKGMSLSASELAQAGQILGKKWSVPARRSCSTTGASWSRRQSAVSPPMAGDVA